MSIHSEFRHLIQVRENTENRKHLRRNGSQTSQPANRARYFEPYREKFGS